MPGSISTQNWPNDNHRFSPGKLSVRRETFFFFFFCILWCFDILGALLAGERLPFPVLVYKDSKQLARKCALQLEINQSETLIPSLFLSDSHTQPEFPLPSVTPGPELTGPSYSSEPV